MYLTELVDLSSGSFELEGNSLKLFFVSKIGVKDINIFNIILESPSPRKLEGYTCKLSVGREVNVDNSVVLIVLNAISKFINCLKCFEKLICIVER